MTKTLGGGRRIGAKKPMTVPLRRPPRVQAMTGEDRTRRFDFTVTVRVDGPATTDEARKKARETLLYHLDRDGHWLAASNKGTVTMTRISRGTVRP